MISMAMIRLMSLPLIAALFTLSSFSAHANSGNMDCYGEIDPGASYRITAEFDKDLKVSGHLQIKYEDNDGFTFTSEVKPTMSEISLLQSLQIRGPFSGGTMTLAAAYAEADDLYTGILIATGSEGEGFMIDINCRIKIPVGTL